MHDELRDKLRQSQMDGSSAKNRSPLPLLCQKRKAISVSYAKNQTRNDAEW